MGGGEQSSSSASLDPSEAEMGSQRELINMKGALLHLIDGEESVLMQSGDFSLKLLKQTHSPLAVVIANVGEVQWPVGKDAAVLKVFTRRYTFALPGLVYGVILPDSISALAIQQFEAILAEYSTFETHHEIPTAVQSQLASAKRDNAGYWTAVAPEVESLSSQVARQIDSTSSVVANSIVVGGDWAALGIKHGVSLLKRKGPDSPPGAGGGVSPRMMKRMQQARRMSAVAKLMSRTLLKGAISASGHVSKRLGLDVNAMEELSGPIYLPEEDTSARKVAVASVDAFGKVVEAVETAGKSVYDVTQKVGTEVVQERFGDQAGKVLQDSMGAVGNVINTAWTLNKLGVTMLLRMTAASTALSTRPAPTSTGMTMKQQQRSPPGGAGGPPSHHLQHRITPSPQHSPQSSSVPLTLLPASDAAGQQQLQTSQLFPTSAEQMRNQAVVGLPAASPLFVPPGNFTAIIPPGPRANSPFQQYHRASSQPSQPSQPSPPSFSFQPRENMHME